MDDLIAGSKKLGLSLSSWQIDQLADFAKMLATFKNKINLTAIREEDFIPLHFLDSLSCCLFINFHRINRLLDIGSGAGFPGLVLKIAFPELNVTLVDKIGKKIGFLDLVCSKLKLKGVQTVHSRAELLANNPDHAASYDLVTARALAKLPKLLQLLTPFAKRGGEILALKSSNICQELEASTAIASELGVVVKSIETITIPNTTIGRTAVIFSRR